MKKVTFLLEEDLYEQITKAAFDKKIDISDLAKEIVMNWIKKDAGGNVMSQEDVKRRYIRLRIQDKPIEHIGKELGISQTILEGWENDIRQTPNEWMKTFIFIRKSTDPLTWELKIQDRFYDIWGKKPD